MSAIWIVILCLVVAFVFLCLGWYSAIYSVHKKHYAGTLTVTNTNDSPTPYMHLELNSKDGIEKAIKEGGPWALFDVRIMTVNVDSKNSSRN